MGNEKERESGGKRNYGFRGGDRSEYLARFAFSRVAFVWPVPRQEDYGVVDLACILSRDENRAVFPESAFYVQVKSNEQDLAFSEDEARWISRHMSNPLFVAFVDKKADTLTLFSCSRVLRALLIRSQPKHIAFKLGPPPAGTEHTNLRAEADRATAEIYAGPPIFRQTLSEIEADSGPLRTVLRAWIALDAVMLANRALSGLTSAIYQTWELNEVPTVIVTESLIGPNYEVGERAIAPVLTSLAHNYRDAKNRDKLDAVLPLMKALAPLLDDHGRKFVSGELRIED